MGINTLSGPRVSVRREGTIAWRHVDLTLLVSSLAVSALGLLMIYSATEHRLREAGISTTYYLTRQAMWVILGLGAMALVSSIDYRRFLDFFPVIYVAMLLLLIAVLSPLGTSSRGTQAWFQLGPYQLQPSEYAKIAFIVCLAAYGASHEGDLDARRLGGALGLSAVPIGLIFLQPDFGTAMVFVAVLMATLLVAGARLRHLAVLAVAGLLAGMALVQLNVLKDYQLDRLGAFLDQEGDTQQSAYNQTQSKTAIGAGGFIGRGLLAGTQTNLSYVPEQHTDFIFTAVGEQLGFVGAVTLLGLFVLIAWRTWRTATLARDLYGTLVCVGVLSMFAFQMFENVGMAMGIMPITGIPLPLMSYGGSSTMVSFISLGLVQSISMRLYR